MLSPLSRFSPWLTPPQQLLTLGDAPWLLGRGLSLLACLLTYGDITGCLRDLPPSRGCLLSSPSSRSLGIPPFTNPAQRLPSPGPRLSGVGCFHGDLATHVPKSTRFQEPQVVFTARIAEPPDPCSVTAVPVPRATHPSTKFGATVSAQFHGSPPRPGSCGLPEPSCHPGSPGNPQRRRAQAEHPPSTATRASSLLMNTPERRHAESLLNIWSSLLPGGDAKCFGKSCKGISRITSRKGSELGLAAGSSSRRIGPADSRIPGAQHGAWPRAAGSIRIC